MERPDGGYVLEILERERERLARDIHDGPAQYLTNTAMRLDVIKRLLDCDRHEDVARELERLHNILRLSINDVRRMIFDLRTTCLEHGLHQAVHMYSAQFDQTHDIRVTVTGDWTSVSMGRAEEAALFRVYQELLNNVHKHAEATAVEVTLAQQSRRLVLSVRDNGRGFNPDVRTGLSFGLQGIRERLGLLHGTFDIQSAPGIGTCVRCEVPVQHE